jgi:hypothetical protein
MALTANAINAVHRAAIASADARATAACVEAWEAQLQFASTRVNVLLDVLAERDAQIVDLRRALTERDEDHAEIDAALEIEMLRAAELA